LGEKYREREERRVAREEKESIWRNWLP